MSLSLNLRPVVLACLAACALLIGASSGSKSAVEIYEVELGEEVFQLEVAADDATRKRGLSGRASIAADGGMIFVFPDAAIRWFHMRDCLVPIDILFLDSHGVITTTGTMWPESPRMAGESERAYIRRLRRYHSRSPSHYVIELRAGTIERIGLAPGDLVTLDTRWLQRLVPGQ